MLKIQTGKKNEILRAISSEIEISEFNKYIKLGQEMIKFIKNPKNSGVGLAAPQVGYNKRLVVVSLLKTRKDKTFKTIIMINPEIIEKSKETDLENEGCLSLPGDKGEVARNISVKVSYTDERKKKNILYLSGVSSRIVQHEVDHLDGILFTDRVNKNVLLTHFAPEN